MADSDRVFGISMMRDEVDVAAHVLQHLVEEGFDGIIVADNNSKDGTRELLRAMAESSTRCQISVYDDPEVAYYQSAKMTGLAHAAALLGADWIVPFDADEIWYAPNALAQTLRECEYNLVAADLYNHFATDFDLPTGIPFSSMVYRHPEVGKLPKVAYRYDPDITIDPGNHSVSRHSTTLYPHPYLSIRHFPYRGFEHFCHKARNGAEAYKATDYPHQVGAHWREYGAILENHGEAALKEVYDQWFHFSAPVTAGLILDPAPFRRWN